MQNQEPWKPLGLCVLINTHEILTAGTQQQKKNQMRTVRTKVEAEEKNREEGTNTAIFFPRAFQLFPEKTQQFFIPFDSTAYHRNFNKYGSEANMTGSCL